MTLITNKSPIVDLNITRNPLDIINTLNSLLYVPDDKLRPRIILELATYLQKKINNADYNLKLFTLTKNQIPTGFVVCQIDPEYKSYGMKCATFGWLHANDFESCRILMDACEHYVRENKLKKLRGPINYPKYIGGVGYQILGHSAPMMNGVAFNSPEMKEFGYLTELGYIPESEYSCVEVVQKSWEHGKDMDEDIIIRFHSVDEIVDLEDEIYDLARNSFYSVLADAPGGKSRIEEMIESYRETYKKFTSQLIEIDPAAYFESARFIEIHNNTDIEKSVPCCPMAFDKTTGKLVGMIMALPNLYQLWNDEKLTHTNVDTAMIKKEYAGKGIFSALNNIGQLMCRMKGVNYIEGTTIWSNNDRAIKTIFPHSILRRKHVVFQKRLLRK